MENILEVQQVSKTFFKIKIFIGKCIYQLAV